MNVLDKFYDKEEKKQRVYQIEDELYQRLLYMSENIKDASMNQMLEECIRHIVDTGNIVVCESKSKSAHTYCLRASTIESLEKFKEKYSSLSIATIVNIALKNAFKEYDIERPEETEKWNNYKNSLMN